METEPASLRLAALIPFYKDDPSALIAALASQASGDDLTIVARDDGSGDAALIARVEDAAERASATVQVQVDPVNRGRAAGRNLLAQAAAGLGATHALFLDADMALTHSGFLARWTEAARRHPGAVQFGGFIAVGPRRVLHAALAAHGDSPPPDERARAPWRHVATSNLLAPIALLLAEPFDEGFQGWGWEDVEWAARVQARAPIRHIDNPAGHAGLEPAGRLLRRARASAGNFARFAHAHPEAAAQLATHAWAKRFKATPGAALTRPALAALARAPLPAKARAAAYKLYRASWYGAAL